MKTNKYNGSIEKRLRKIVLFITSITFFITYTVFVILYLKDEKNKTINLSKTIQTVISQDLAKLIFLNDVASAADITTKLRSFDILESVVVYKNNKRAIFQYSKENKSFNPTDNCANKNIKTVGHTLIINAPVSYSGKKLGCISMKLNYITFFDIFKKYVVQLALFYLIIILLSYILSYYYAKKFTTPILKLIVFLEQIELTTSLNERIDITENDEFGKLYEETNIMLESLENSLQAKQETEEKLEYLQQYDSLTGLSNKNLFLKSLQKQIDSYTTKSWHLMFCIDITKFKILNDVYGHELGDMVLQMFAQRLGQEFKDATIMSKIGIDEFLLCYRNISDSENSAILKSEDVLNKLSSIASKAFYVENKEIYISTHVGVNVFSSSLTNAVEILKETDGALQSAKKEEMYFSFYNKDIEKRAQDNLSLYSGLLRAIKENQFELYYQLQYKDDGSILGAESLIRWIHPTKGVISPITFIPIAESTGLIIDIGTWVLEAASQQLSLWQKNSKTKDWVIAVNVSAKQFVADNFLSLVEENIKRYNLNPKNLKIELTESLLANDIDVIIQKMKELRKSGIKISIDDFGTGYSSLQYLKSLPIDQIKIDQNFVFGMLKNETDKIIVQTIINLGKAFNFDIIAEGVESKEDFELLKMLHCHHFQGYYFAKPEPIEKINKLIQTL